MCVQGQDHQLVTPRELDQEQKEFRIGRECGWFSVRYYDRRTLSGDRTRYVYVNQDRYGVVWHNVGFFILGHAVFAYSMLNLYKYKILGAWLYAYAFGFITSIGITAGAHRLWSHKAYKASTPFRILLAILFTATGQNDIFTWARDHRLHHKFTETDADPHNSRRGAFFAHVGWLLTKKHPDVFVKGKTIDNSDLMADPVVYWNKKLYILWYIIFRVYIPTLIPMVWYDQEFRICVLGTFSQYMMNLHSVWFVNSAAHIFGDRPYNNKIQPRENIFVAFFGMNEGFHNYHHQFPWDYAIAEHGIQWWDPAKWFIDMFNRIGWAYDLKKASPKLVHDTKEKYAKRLEKEEVFNEFNFYVHDHPYFEPHRFCEENTESTPFHNGA